MARKRYKPVAKLRQVDVLVSQGQNMVDAIRRTPHLDTGRQHRRCSCLPSPRGRLRSAERLRRPRWRNRQP
jgi:hypothetical protein